MAIERPVIAVGCVLWIGVAALFWGCWDRAGYQRIDPRQGFGDTNNKYSWSMAELGGQIYVGTLNIRVPFESFGSLVQDLLTDPVAVLEQYESIVDTDGAEIWRYTPQDGTWQKVLEWDPLESTCRHASLSIL